MSSTTNPIEVEAFEQIHASSRMALLRLIFRLSGRGKAPISKLLVNNHTSSHRVAPLPSLPAPGGAERAAFAVPYELLEGDRTFSLELDDGVVIDLPSPMAPSIVPAVPSSASSSSGLLGGRSVVLEGPSTGATHRSDVQASPTPMATETLTADPDRVNEERLLAETEARAEAEDEALQLRAELQQLRAQADEHARQLEAQCGQLERRLADALSELEAVTKAERRAVREVFQLKEKVAHQASQIDQRQPPPG
jgi:hypothetical protein